MKEEIIKILEEANTDWWWDGQANDEEAHSAINATADKIVMLVQKKDS